MILAEQLLDSTSIAAALLHDVVEDSDVGVEDIAREFGPEVGGHRGRAHQDLPPDLPLHRPRSRSRTTASCCCRSPRTRGSSSSSWPTGCTTCGRWSTSRRRSGSASRTETREIYAPLAHRFGMAGIKAELEDLAFKFLEPEEYRALAEQVAAKRAAREQMIDRLRRPLEQELKRRRHRRRRGHRAPQAPLVDLPEDEEAEQAVRRDLRPAWRSASS